MKKIIGADVREWKAVGEPEVLAKLYGAYLKKQTFRDPNGEEHVFSIFGGKNWATICPITTEGNLVLVEQFKQGNRAIGFEFPAGTIGEGEELEDTAIRELREETGYEAAKMMSMHKHHISTRKSDCFFQVFIARDCTLTADRSLDKDEVIRVWEADPQEFWEMVLSGLITEPSTLVAAQYAQMLGLLPPYRQLGM